MNNEKIALFQNKPIIYIDPNTVKLNICKL